MHYKRNQIVVLGAVIFLLPVLSMVLAQDGKPSTDEKPTVREAVDYNRDIKPLLSDRCYHCHGPDGGSREAGFRLDIAESAFGEADSGERPIVPGKPEESELLRRISLELDADDSSLMPPEEAHKPRFTAKEIETIRLWIKQGAKYDKHWSFVAPRRAAVPKDSSGWAKHPIDHFVIQQMRKSGLSPSLEASRAKLIRRVTLDLTGLPPTPAEVESFVNDQSPGAYEKVVDRLLNSPRYGEHMARFWLDAVRYGDTHGLHLDNYREVWPYRDWVIRSFNQNMSWKDFTVKQIAGDLLPKPTIDDLTASGFNRMHVSTNEGGSIKEEVYVRNVVDRVSTTGTVFMGLSIGCAQCHDHKFDPISARDFYQMFAFFNNLEADPMDGNGKAHAPVISIPTPESTKKLSELQTKIAGVKKQISAPDKHQDAAFHQWQAKWEAAVKSLWNPLSVEKASAANGTTLNLDDQNQIVTATGTNPAKETVTIELKTQMTGMTGLRLNALLGENGLAGRAPNGNAVLSEFQADIQPLDGSTKYTPLRFISADADFAQGNFPVKAAIDQTIDDKTGWAIAGHQHKADRQAAFFTDKPFGFEGGTKIRVRLVYKSLYAQHSFQRVRLFATTDGRFAGHVTGGWNMTGSFVMNDRQAAYHRDFGPEADADLMKTYTYTDSKNKKHQVNWKKQPKFVDGKVHLIKNPKVGAYYLSREIIAPSAREVSFSLGSDDAVKVWLNGELVHENNVARGAAANQDTVKLPLRQGTNTLLVKIVNFGGAAGFYWKEKESTFSTPDLQTQLYLATPAGKRTKLQRTQLRNFFDQTDPKRRALMKSMKQLEAQVAKVNSSLPTTLIMKERQKPRPAYVLNRGEYDQPNKQLGPMARKVPSFLPLLPKTAPNNRLGFAQWLVMPEHPLLARVTVNRFWQQLMGTGIVATSNDFGAQGERPSHPELLDWLAVEFRESDWNVKSLIKQIVLSKTYRQDSVLTKETYKLDPKNRLLARGPRYRLDAEMLRDQALSVSGLMVHKLGGPGVKPPQPGGLWKAVGYVGSNTSRFQPDSGHDKVHRRSIYTFWKRTAPPPQMSVFDAPSREECVVTRERTNTPLQALLLLNDPQYFEAARHLANRVLKEKPGTKPEDQAKHMFYLATLRKPTSEEISLLTSVYKKQHQRFQKDAAAAKTLLSVGEFAVPEQKDLANLAAWTVVANVVLNLDEVITKQ